MTATLRKQLDRDGYAVLDDVLDAAACARLLDALVATSDGPSRRRGGTRNMLKNVAAVRELADAAPLRAIVDQALSDAARPVRAILFDKTPEANWLVPWHQDRTIAVSHVVDDLDGYGPWSSKAGVTHVQPPAHVLDRMVTLRLHLDACDADNGALQVIPGSHRTGITDERPSPADARTCPVRRGGVLAMRPLLWHASSKARDPSHRRVLHIEYADARLPPPLQWSEQAADATA